MFLDILSRHNSRLTVRTAHGAAMLCSYVVQAPVQLGPRKKVPGCELADGRACMLRLCPQGRWYSSGWPGQGLRKQAVLVCTAAGTALDVARLFCGHLTQKQLPVVAAWFRVSAYRPH
jgi:hypothetical protein